LPLTPIAVGYVRKAYAKLKSRFDRLRERGLLNISEMAKACGVSVNTIGHWRRKGHNPGAPYQESNPVSVRASEAHAPKKFNQRTVIDFQGSRPGWQGTVILEAGAKPGSPLTSGEDGFALQAAGREAASLPPLALRCEVEAQSFLHQLPKKMLDNDREPSYI
jgi:hypothetical protein